MDSPGNGLTHAQAKALQNRYGRNELVPQKKNSLAIKILHVVLEPMFVLLLAAAAIYFILGEARDGAIMLLFVCGIIGIDVIQEWKTDKTLNALKSLSEPHVTVKRDGTETRIASAELVPGDLMLVREGDRIPADGTVVRCSDLCVDESTLTGESERVWKIPALPEPRGNGEFEIWRKDRCYAGTLAVQGTALVRVDTIGASTEYGKIGVHVANAREERTPLQAQTGGMVKLCTGIAAVLFALVSAATWMNIRDHAASERLTHSVLSGIALTMAMIPEEFPVILTVFLSMGAWRLGKKNSLVRRLPSVETMGSVSVLCVDKTGTITENRMTVQETWSPDGDDEALIETMGLACETDTYDPMEKAMLAFCERNDIGRDHLFAGNLIHEYPFTNERMMMGHVWRHDGETVIAAKGSPEHILTLCGPEGSAFSAARSHVRKMSEQGLRVIAVAIGKLSNRDAIPASLTDCRLSLSGLVGLADPPRESVKENIATCNKAGIRTVIITGDNGVTAAAVARKIGVVNTSSVITGEMLDAMTDEALCDRVKDVSVFSRVLPEHKMRIVRAFQQNGDIVAMTGDGVNDAPALKHADIGIAMGRRGSEVSREAADLILLDDNFSTIVTTIRNGRRIFDNIVKAVEYVLVVHIPIAVAAFLAPALQIAPAALMIMPIHVLMLELVIDPTCSIVFEAQPAEPGIMD
ncbi:MAG: HAD-IC family P-type ATPase, partial [Clostridia bacterium]|nr:HAD-IC family P-type ATPase [Clostridia bacterium]